jgi:hypothetical protein
MYLHTTLWKFNKWKMSLQSLIHVSTPSFKGKIYTHKENTWKMLFAIVSTHNIINFFPSKFLLNVNVKYMFLTYAKENFMKTMAQTHQIFKWVLIGSPKYKTIFRFFYFHILYSQLWLYFSSMIGTLVTPRDWKE